MNLNHIFLFLAIVSPLLVLARAWRPSAPYHGWRLAALVVLAVTAVAWLLWPDVSGYVGGAAWFLLLFLPAIALRKITQLAAQGDYESAGRLGAALQILHPTAELREQVRLFRHLKSNAAHSRAFSSVPADHDIAHFHSAQSASKRAGRARIDSGQRACFPIRDFCWGLERSKSSASDWRGRAGRGCCARRILASVHCAFSTWRLFASRVQSFRPLRSRSAARALHRHDPISRVLSNFRARLQRRGGCFNRDRAGSGRLNS